MCNLFIRKNHPRIESIANSWAWKCDGFFVASTVTNETIGTVDLPHDGPEAYDNIWQKTRSIWAYIHDNYVDDYDFFWIVGDDFFLVVENLVNMLASIQTTKGSEKPLYLAHQVPMRGGGVFCGGGAGYVLNKVAVKRLIAEALPTCHVSQMDNVKEMKLKSYILQNVCVGILDEDILFLFVSY
jgi:glycoprotein-N-acetylgalactosamine 3-beta-galactosyltransferase